MPARALPHTPQGSRDKQSSAMNAKPMELVPRTLHRLMGSCLRGVVPVTYSSIFSAESAVRGNRRQGKVLLVP